MKDNIYCVIMAGGIGSRFWPLSRKTLPKQFLDFFGTGRTLIQQTFDRYNRIVPSDHIYIVTNSDYTNIVKEQLPEIIPSHILAEPTRRNTAPCLAWATYHILAINPKANIVFTPSDHLILKEEEFVNSITDAFHFVHNNDRLLCIGIRPTRPETRYGYIQANDSDEGIFHHVKTFTEKPEQELAEVFIESGEFYWNAGIFIGKARDIVDSFHQHVPELANIFESSGEDTPYGTNKEQEFIDTNFPSCPNVSIEDGILEKAGNVFVMTCDFGWSDLGTWSTYYDTLPKDSYGNSRQRHQVMLYDCHNCFVGSRIPGKLIAVQGLEDYLIADTDNILLICPKDDTNTLRKIINDAQVKMGEDYV